MGRKLSVFHNTNVSQDALAIFDLYGYNPSANSRVEFVVPDFPRDFKCGLIYGNSGSGKSLIAQSCFCNPFNLYDFAFDNTPLIDSGHSAAETSRLLQRFRMNIIPSWGLPFDQLSAGEKYRVRLMRLYQAIENSEFDYPYIVLDEFASFLDQHTADGVGATITKLWQELPVPLVCIANKPVDGYWDWQYSTDDGVFTLPEKKKYRIAIKRISYKDWRYYARYHYLTAELLPSCKCYAIYADDVRVGFVAILNGYGADDYRISRIVLLPAHQGRGLTPQIFKYLQQWASDRQGRLKIVARHPAIIATAHKLRLPINLTNRGLASITLGDYRLIR